MKEEHCSRINEIAPRDTKMLIEVLVSLFLISRTRILLNIKTIIKLAQFLILSAFSKLFKTAR